MGVVVSRHVASPGPCWKGARTFQTATGSREQSLEHWVSLCLCNAVAKQRFPSECLKQNKAQAFDVSAFPPTPASQGYEKPLYVNRFVPFLDKLWCSEMEFFPSKCWFSQ